MNRTLGGIPIIGWAIGVVAIVGGIVWFRRQQAKSGTGAPGSASAPQFSQTQEVQDFQVFSALTSQQQASDEAYVGQLIGLFSGGPSTGATGGVTGGGGTQGGSAVPSPPSTGTVPPATAPAAASSTPPASSLPGYGAGVAQLQAANPGLAGAPGIAGYGATYNGVPI